MSRRIEIELTSAQDDGSFTWRAAGAKQPKGVVSTAVLPTDAKVGDTLKVEIEQTMDGIEVQSVVQGRQRTDKAESLELLPTETDFKPIVETRAPGRRRRDGDRKGKRRRDDEGRRDGRGDGRGEGRGDGRGRGDRQRDRGPRHAPPPEVPTRPKPKRLRAGKTHRNEVLAELPEEQRPIAEVALQGMSAVRQRLATENERAVAEGRPTMPEAAVLKMAEDMLPKLRVAEWRDRAEAAKSQLNNLDLRDLRSVVAAGSDPVVARDESTRTLAAELSEALITKQEAEMQLWFGDIDAALAVGRVIRALRLSAQPPKAGVPFPVDIAERLTLSANAALTPAERPDRWVATLEAAAFSPVHTQIVPMGVPAQVPDELTATVTRLAPALPQVAAAFGLEVDPSAPFPKPLRPDYGKRRRERSGGKPPSDKASGARGDHQDRKPRKGASSGQAPTPPSESTEDVSTPASASADAEIGIGVEPGTPSVAEVIDGPSSSELARAEEAEAVAEAEVVEEAEAITEAAAQAEASAPEVTPESNEATEVPDNATSDADADDGEDAKHAAGDETEST